MAGVGQRDTEKHTRLNKGFQPALSKYSDKGHQSHFYDDTIEELQGKLKVGRQLSRTEMNER
jgi:hypothetical protein